MYGFIVSSSATSVKIEYSGAVLLWMKQLRIGNAVQLRLEFKFKSSQYRLHELQLHAHFNDFNVHGEWFKFPTDPDYDAIVTKSVILTLFTYVIVFIS